jgi:hypothetical protein
MSLADLINIDDDPEPDAQMVENNAAPSNTPSTSATFVENPVTPVSTLTPTESKAPHPPLMTHSRPSFNLDSLWSRSKSEAPA